MEKVWKDFEITPLSVIKDSHKLLDFQQYSVYCALNKKSYLLGLPTGGGKTFTSLATYFYYKEKYPNTKLIIVTNKSAIFQFDSEISKFFNYEKCRTVIHSEMTGNYKKARENAYSEFENNSEILILNYQNLKSDIDKIIVSVSDFKQKSPDNKVFIIYDEATAFKNTGTLTYKTVLKLNLLVDKFIALTATLTKGKLEEAYGIFKGIGISITKSKAQFIREFCVTKKIPRLHIEQIIGYKNISKFKEIIDPHCIILNKTDISDSLPSFTTNIVYCTLDSAQKEMLKLIKSGYFIKDDVEQDNAMLLKMMEFGFNRRCLIDPNIVYSEDEKIPNYKSPKTIEILDLLNDSYSNEKIVIYSHSKKYIDILEKTISSEVENSSYKKVLKITGDITAQDREKSKQLFTESEKHNIILINTAGLESINLQISGTLIVCDIPTSAGNLIQLLGRISRIGSKHKQLSVNYLLMKDQQDESEYFIINKQLYLLNNIIGESEKNIIDFEYLKQDKAFSGMSDEELSTMSIDQILYNRDRKKS